jgi:hypothetical protein
MRSSSEIYADLSARGRTPEQILSVAMARGDADLLALAEREMADSGLTDPARPGSPSRPRG